MTSTVTVSTPTLVLLGSSWGAPEELAEVKPDDRENWCEVAVEGP